MKLFQRIRTCPIRNDLFGTPEDCRDRRGVNSSFSERIQAITGADNGSRVPVHWRTVDMLLVPYRRVKDESRLWRYHTYRQCKSSPVVLAWALLAIILMYSPLSSVISS